MSSGTRTRPERRGYDKITYSQHVERVKSMAPTIDCGPPRAHPLSNKREKDKIREFANIEFDNKLLLERLAKVVQQKTIDNEIHKSVQMHAQFKKKLGLTKKRLGSMVLAHFCQFWDVFGGPKTSKIRQKLPPEGVPIASRVLITFLIDF